MQIKYLKLRTQIAAIEMSGKNRTMIGGKTLDGLVKPSGEASAKVADRNSKLKNYNDALSILNAIESSAAKGDYYMTTKCTAKCYALITENIGKGYWLIIPATALTGTFTLIIYWGHKSRLVMNDYAQEFKDSKGDPIKFLTKSGFTTKLKLDSKFKVVVK